MKGLANIEYHLSQPESDRLRLVLNIGDGEGVEVGLGTPRPAEANHAIKIHAPIC